VQAKETVVSTLVAEPIGSVTPFSLIRLQMFPLSPPIPRDRSLRTNKGKQLARGAWKEGVANSMDFEPNF